MRRLAQVAPYLLVLAFAIWCAVALRGDLAQLSPAPLLRSWGIVLLTALLSLINYALRIVRWRAYLARLGHSVSFRFATLSFIAGFAYTLSPGKLGEMARAQYYVPLGVPLADVAAAFFAERLMDLIVMVILAALLLTAYPAYHGVIYTAAALVLLALTSLGFVPWNAFATRLQPQGKTPGTVRRALIGLVSALAATRRLMSPGVLISGLVLGLIAWSLEGVGLGLLSSIFPPLQLDLATAVGIYGVAVLIGGLSFLPGGLGSTEAVMTALLTTRGYHLSEALLITLSCRLLTLWFAVVLGWLTILAFHPKRSPAMVLPWQ
jgi:glycosyltransferase 2 family protein